MKIAIDARFYGLENGGLGRYTMNFLEQLSIIDHTNNYFILLRKPYSNSLRMPSNFVKVEAEARHYSVKEQLLIPNILKGIKPDVVHFLHFNAPVFYSGTYILTIHDLLMHKGVGKEATTLSPLKYKVKRLAYRTVFDRAIKNAKAIIVPSQFVENEIKGTYKIPKGKIKVIHEGVTPFSNKALVEKNNAPYFFYVGNAYPHKNLKTLIKAISLLNKDKKEKVKLMLITPRDVFTNRLQSIIKSEDAQQYVNLKSGVSDNELFSLYKNAKALVYPSFSEGFGLQGIEAMSIGTRVIASNIPVFHELYQKHALFFDPYSAEDIAQKMNLILSEDPQKRTEMLKKARVFTQQYSWEKMAHEILAQYKALSI